jgi:hypothetical protein
MVTNEERRSHCLGLRAELTYTEGCDDVARYFKNVEDTTASEEEDKYVGLLM